MDTPTPFNLDAAIIRWQQELAVSPAFDPDNLEELATHLRDSTLRLQTAGLSGEEAFLVAARRLGGPDKLSVEFAKTNPGLVWHGRTFWMLAGVFVFLAVSDLARLASTAVMWVGGLFRPDGFLLGWIGTAAFACVIAGAVFLVRQVVAGRLTGVTASLGRLLGRRRLAMFVLSGGAVGLKVVTLFLWTALIHQQSPMMLGQALTINSALGSLAAILTIFIVVIAMTRPGRTQSSLSC